MRRIDADALDDLTLYCPNCGAYMSNEGGEK